MLHTTAVPTAVPCTVGVRGLTILPGCLSTSLTPLAKYYNNFSVSTWPAGIVV